MTGSKGGIEAELTSIRISKGVRFALLQRGKKGETYEEIIRELIDESNHYRIMKDATIEIMKPKKIDAKGWV